MDEFDVITIMIKRGSSAPAKVDIGGVDVYRAASILTAASNAAYEACPWPDIESNGVPIELVGDPGEET